MDSLKYDYGDIGTNFQIGGSSRIDVSRLQIGNNVQIGKGVEIYANQLRLGDYVRIGDGVKIFSLETRLGDAVILGARSRVENLRGLTIGPETFITPDVWFEASLARGVDSFVDIGERGLICQGTRVNAEERVKIGDYVGIGQGVSIWTHGYHPDRLKGMPGGQGPVTIGDRVWLIAGSTVDPGVNIGAYSVIGTGSLVNKNIPPGSFAGGMPAKILKEGIFPRELREEEKGKIIDDALGRYAPVMQSKGIVAEIYRVGTDIIFRRDGEELTFDESSRTIRDRAGNMVRDLSPQAEDLRDFLRSQAIGYWTGRPFESMIPDEFKKLRQRVNEG